MARARSGAEIEGLALYIVKRYQPEVLQTPMAFDVERFFECELEEITGVDTDYRQLNPGIHGFTNSESMECVISLELADDPSQHFFCRSTISHEIGHAIQHVPEFRKRKELLKSIHDAQHVPLTLYRESDIPLYCNPEWQAWRFAGALLMPAPTMRLAMEECRDVISMSRLFQVNPAFVKTRLRVLKISL